MNNRRQVFALFKSIFLRNRSLSNVRLFYGKDQKKRKIGKGNLYLTKHRFSRNKNQCGVWPLSTIICVTYVQKDF